MEKSRVSFRVLQKEDYSLIEKMISDTWEYQTFCEENKTVKRLARFYLQSCLMEQNFVKVALVNDEVVGIVMAKSNKSSRFSLQYGISSLYAYLLLMLTKEGRHIGKMFAKFHKVNTALLEQSNQTFDGELVFFVLDEKARGMGIGKQLLQQVKDYMHSECATSFYLFSDSTCNYAFYENQGLERIAQKPFSLQPYHDETIVFFLYQYNFKSELHT